MSSFLRQLISLEEPMFSNGLRQLEKSTGNSGTDVKLIADIMEKSHEVMRRLALDTTDTSGQELYFALIEAVRSGMAEDILVDTDYVLVKRDNKVISMNMIDVVENSHHELSYNNQTVSHGQRSLRGELLSRYINHARTDEQTTKNIAKSTGLIDQEA